MDPDENEFDLVYNEELELMEEMEDQYNENLVKDLEPQAHCSKDLMDSEKRNRSSPFFSQSSFASTIAPSGDNKIINRRLFDSPVGSRSKPISSTPILKTNKPKNTPLSFVEDHPQLEIIHEEFNEEPALEPNEPFTELQNIGLYRKRRLADLFGEDGRDDLETKKMKSDEENDLALIERILEARKLNMLIDNPLQQDDLDKAIQLRDFKKRNLSHTIPDWPCIALTDDSNNRMYVRMHSENYETEHINYIKTFKKGFTGLLGDSKEQIWEAAKEISLKFLLDPEPSQTITTTEVVPLKTETLWVEKYKPKKYIDLLSDETTNRTLLVWLKMWDKIVFGREFNLNKTIENKTNSFNKKTGRFETVGAWNRRAKTNLNMDLDSSGRPMQKIALLSGAPGLGKTTQAHIVARHAGYNICELNASSDRSPEAFRLALENGTQMTSVLNINGRPNCIILDEIDGAPIQSIDFLIKFVSDNYSTKPKKAGAKVEKNILKRPIICICNDIYAPSLRHLRQIALVLNFPPIESTRLAERLLEITSREKMNCDLSAMLALAEKSGNDIRSCISMLQFYNSCKKQITLHDILSSNLGKKDTQKNLFGVWSSIFQIKKAQRERINNLEKGAQTVTISNTLSTRAKDVLDAVHMSGDYERLIQGVFENYLHQRLYDPNLDGLAEATNWFCFTDSIQKHINSLQNYTCYPYLQFGFVTWHLLFASFGWPKINFPTKGYEAQQKTTSQNYIFQALKRGMSTGNIGIGEGKIILIDAVPLLKKILSPKLRSVSLQLLNTKERYDLNHTVAVMTDLGINFTQIRAADGTYQYTIEPDLDLLCKFEGSQGITLNYLARQLIAREIEIEQIKRATPKLKEPSITNTQTKIQKTLKCPPSVPNHLQNLKPKIRQHKNTKETIFKDFFGRISKKQIPLTTNEGGTNSIVKSPIWYKYKEGFNNAVRKDVHMSELL